MVNIKKKHDAICKKCNKLKPYYAKDMCKICYNKNWGDNHPEYILSYRKRYHIKNKDRIAAYHKKWYQKNKRKYKNRHVTKLGNPNQDKEILKFIEKKRLGMSVKKYGALSIKKFKRTNERRWIHSLNPFLC